MGDLTGRILKLAARNRQTTVDPVQEAIEEILHGDSKEAGLKIAGLSPEEVKALQDELAKIGGGPEMPTHNSQGNPAAKVGETVPESKSRSKAGPSTPREDVTLGKGTSGKSDTTPSGSKPGTVADLLNLPVSETLRTPDGDAGDLKMAEFSEGWVEGIKEAMAEITDLVAQHGRLDLRQHFGTAFDKVAAEIGEEAAIAALQEAFAEGQKQAMREIQENEEVKMGSLRNLVEDQAKIATVDDLRGFGRKLGREALLTKLAEEQAAVEDDEVAEAAEAAAVVNAIAEKALEDPASLTPEEAEVLLEVGDAIEDVEADVVGEEKVTTITDIAAYLRHYGYGV